MTRIGGEEVAYNDERHMRDGDEFGLEETFSVQLHDIAAMSTFHSAYV